MFKKFNINEKVNIKAELLRNRREPIADITDYISKISYKLNSYSTVDISVKKFIMDKNIKKPNPLYNKIKDKMQIILTINDKKERYILMDSTRSIDKNSGIKTFKAYSFEKTLENKLITFSSEGKSYPLVSDDTDEGILDIISKKCGWKIGFVDELAKNEYVYNPIVRTQQIQKNINCLNVQPDQLLWEASTDIYTDIDSVPLNATVEHKGLTRHDYYGDQLTSEETLKITLDPVHTGINNIKAYYHSVAGNRYGIKFLLYLKDGSTITQIKEFTNIRDLQMKCKEVNVIYETGYWDKQFVTKYAWLENIDSNIYSLLNDLQEQFNVVFLFDTYNGVINCYSKDNLNDESPLLLSLDTNIINVDVKQAQNPISAVKVIGKENISIIDINKYGADVIYNYDYFRNNDLLSDELIQSLDKYEKFLEAKQFEWNRLSEERRLLYDNKVKLDCEIKSLTERITTLSELLAAFISGNASSDEQGRIKKEKTECETLFNENVKLRNIVDEKIDAVNEIMDKITFDIKRENCGIFSPYDLDELSDIDIIENYSNDTATTSDSLFNSASWYLNERTRTTIEFNIKCSNLIRFINNPLGWNNILQLAKLFHIDGEISKEIGEESVRLVGMDIDVKNKSIDNLSFTNKVFPVDLLKKAKQMQKRTVAMIMSDKSRSVSDEGVSKSLVTNQNNPDMFIKSKTNPDNQIYIGSGVCAVSSNGFESSEIAIDNSGIVAKLLKGMISLGENLYIANDDGKELFYIGNIEGSNEFGLCVKDEIDGNQRIFIGIEMDELGVKRAKLKIMNASGEAAITENGLINTNYFPHTDILDSENPLIFLYPIDSNTLELRECKISLFLHKYKTSLKAILPSEDILNTSIQSYKDEDNHIHQIEENHTHELELGILETTMPTNCSLYVNDNLIISGINNDVSISIKDYMKIGENNIIKITSDTPGKIQLNVFNKSFMVN